MIESGFRLLPYPRPCRAFGRPIRRAISHTKGSRHRGCLELTPDAPGNSVPAVFRVTVERVSHACGYSLSVRLPRYRRVPELAWQP
jgi:hypothetical protein